MYNKKLGMYGHNYHILQYAYWDLMVCIFYSIRPFIQSSTGKLYSAFCKHHTVL